MGQSDRARGWRIRQAALALLCVTVASAAPVAASARTRPITFSLQLGYWCVSGRASDSVRVGVTWLDDAGVVKLRGTVRTTATGRWSLCGDAQEDIEAGDVVTARVGLTSRSVTVPSLRVDPDRHGTERSTIHGPANTPLLLTICERRSGEPLRYWTRVPGGPDLHHVPRV